MCTTDEGKSEQHNNKDFEKGNQGTLGGRSDVGAR
jgi:hypothetical protein